MTLTKADMAELLFDQVGLNKREAKDFKQFVDWCYLVAVDTKGLIPVADGDVAEV